MPAFLGALRSIVCGGFVTSSLASANCESDGDEPAFALDGVAKLKAHQAQQASAIADKSSNSAPAAASVSPCCPGSSLEQPCSSSSSQDALEYIAGYCLSRSGVLKCELCCDLLTRPRHMAGCFVRLKEFANVKTGLTKPNAIVINSFVNMEKLFGNCFAAGGIAHKKNLSEHLFELFVKQDVYLPGCQKHSDTVMRCVCIKFIRLRLHQWCRIRMQQIKQSAAATASQKKLQKFS
jgi:hypothetical protein